MTDYDDTQDALDVAGGHQVLEAFEESFRSVVGSKVCGVVISKADSVP
jgi:hypothetical protein